MRKVLISTLLIAGAFVGTILHSHKAAAAPGDVCSGWTETEANGRCGGAWCKILSQVPQDGGRVWLIGVCQG
jgi:hypothetical protein